MPTPIPRPIDIVASTRLVRNPSESTRSVLPTVQLRVALLTSVDDLGLTKPGVTALTTASLTSLWRIAEHNRTLYDESPDISRDNVRRLVRILTGIGVPMGATYSPMLRVLLEMTPLQFVRYELARSSSHLRWISRVAAYHLRINEAVEIGLTPGACMWPNASTAHKQVFRATLELRKRLQSR